MTFSASASAEGYAYTNNQNLVTASASASAISDVSYEDALVQATNLAQEEANVTAQYDVNLINQAVSEATTISTQNINYNTKQINSAPNHTFYYTCNLDKIVYTKTLLGETSLFSTYNGPIYSNAELTDIIGNWSASGNVFNINQTSRKYYDRTGIYNLYLPDGTLCLNVNTQVVKDKNNNFVLEADTYNYPIVAGTGNYLGVTGIISIKTNNYDLTRFVSVYFN